MIARDEAQMGHYLKWYEKLRYTPADKAGIQSLIVIPDTAEQFADVSFYQLGMDWDIYRQNARAVILRVGQNVWKDVEFETHYAGARRVGLLVGGYFFYDGRATPQQQADVIINAMRNKHFDLELFVDWERNYGGQSEGLPNVVKLMQLVEAAGVNCKAVGLYTGFYYFSENSNASANAAQYTHLKQRPLWLAWYASPSVVRVPAPWTTWTHWQWGTPTVSWGQPSAEIDMNKHNGTAAEFTARYGEATELPQEPETEEPMQEAVIKPPTESLRVRSGPGTQYSQIGGLYPGDTAYGVSDPSGWFHISSIKKANGSTVTINGWASMPFLIITDVVETPVGLPDTLWIGETRETVREYRKAA